MAFFLKEWCNHRTTYDSWNTFHTLKNNENEINYKLHISLKFKQPFSLTIDAKLYSRVMHVLKIVNDFFIFHHFKNKICYFWQCILHLTFFQYDDFSYPLWMFTITLHFWKNSKCFMFWVALSQCILIKRVLTDARYLKHNSIKMITPVIKLLMMQWYKLFEMTLIELHPLDRYRETPSWKDKWTFKIT